MNRSYKYKHLDRLSRVNGSNNFVKSCIIFAYTVNINTHIPFLKYLFVHENKVLIFPGFEMQMNEINCNELQRVASTVLIGILDDSTLHDLTFKGYDVQGDVVHIFFDIGNYVNNASKFKFCLIDEIVNTKTCFDYAINEQVSLYFQTNPSLVYLTDDNDRNYENPISGYVYSSTKQTEFVYIFGTRTSDCLSLLGPYYYFTDYSNAFRKSKECVGGDIIRFALIMGSMLVKLNYPSDPIDDSDIKMERLEDGALDRKYECLTMRLSDHGGKWADRHNSVFVGHVELDDGSFIRESPVIVVKKREQYMALDFEYLK
jgi:hypothetical protein